jgi:hypothetical protein
MRSAKYNRKLPDRPIHRHNVLRFHQPGEVAHRGAFVKVTYLPLV